jgi:mono/diheme cytochrome c family protein
MKLPGHRRIFSLSFLVFGAALAFAAAAHSHWDHIPAKDHDRGNPVAAQSEAIASGALIYTDHCAQCHRPDARGDGHKRPSLRTSQLRNATDGDIEWFLRQGDLAHGMPSWSSLPTLQRWQLVTYLRSIRDKSGQ